LLCDNMKIIKETGGFMSDNTKQNNQLNGVYATMNDIIGYENVEKLYIHFKGTQVNFPTKLFSKEYVAEEAKRNYDGTNESINRIAVKYSYSERTIRKLLKNGYNNSDK
jgi:hypothetical protein